MDKTPAGAHMIKQLEFFLVFLIGAVIYSISEIMFRGYTHWTMFFAGGICFAILYRFFTGRNTQSLWKNCLVGALIITGVEFLFGCLFNLVLGWQIWDYSNYPFDVLGQVCLPFSLLWFFLSAPVFWLAKVMEKRMSM